MSIFPEFTGNNQFCILKGVGDRLRVSQTDQLLEAAVTAEKQLEENLTPERVKAVVEWKTPSDEERNIGVRIVLEHFKTVKQLAWHGRGDYLATVLSDAQNRSVLVHQLSKRKSQLPFEKSKGWWKL